MTVSSSTNKVQYNGNGSTTVFAYTFKVFDQDDLTIIIRSASGTETVKTITTHYTVSGVGSAGGGNITMLTAPVTGETITILREQDLIQEFDLVPNDPFPAQLMEDALDKLTFMVQQHSEEIDRSIKASRTNAIGSTEFTVSAADRANKIFGFDGTGELAVTQELGTYRGNWGTATAYKQRDLIKDTSNSNVYICITAHTATGSQPISTNADVAKWALIVDAAAAATSASSAASSASAAATSATNAGNSATAAAGSESAVAASASAAASSASAASSSASSASTSATNAAASQTAASASQTAAATSATNAASSASAASGSASSASTSATNASNSASAASTSATNAASSASSASTSASSASTSATNASTSATNAAASAASAAASFDAFDDIYLGSKSSDPSVDNDGNALTVGDQYFNSSANELRIWNGSTWQAASTVGGTVSSLSVTGVTSIADGSASAPSLTNTGDTNTGLFFPAGDTVGLGTGGIERLRVDSSGNVGIGVTPSAWASGNFVGLQVGSGASIAGRYVAGTEDQIYISTNAYNDGAWKYLATGAATSYYQDDGTHVWRRAASGTAGAAITWSENLRIDASGNVGIGTSSGTGRLTVADGTTAVLTLRATSAIDPAGRVIGTINFQEPEGTGDGTLTVESSISSLREGSDAFNSGGYLTFSTRPFNGSLAERMRIDASGNVGIGVTPSAWGNSGYAAINAKGNASFLGLNAGGTNTQTIVGNNWYDAGLGSPTYIASNFATSYTQFGGQHQFLTAPSGTAGNAITFTQAMTLDAGGNLGIGTTSPSSYNGTASTKVLAVGTTSGNNGVNVISGTTSTGSYLFSDSGGNDRGGLIYYHTADTMAMLTNGAERARIDSSGNLLVGATSPLNSSWRVQAENSVTSGQYSARSTTAGAGKFWHFGASANAFIIYNQADVGLYMIDGATSWTVNSDERMKTTLVPFEDAVGKVCSLRAGTGRYLTDEEDVSRSFLIAQDVQAVLPEAVDVKEDEQGTLGLRYTDVVPLLVAAIKEQQAMIQALQDRLTAANL